ncbi:MAG: carboxypeptidase M32 [Oscillospiraceae bacterium]|nr:carboxypeptidase M32 [Oscillospiraceae bacterium]
MTKTQALELLLQKVEAIKHINSALSIVNWDALTSGVPQKSLPAAGAMVGWLSGEAFRRFVSGDTQEALETLSAFASELSLEESAMLRELNRQYTKLKSVPPEEHQEFSALTAQSQVIWETARAQNDFGMMLPYYEKIFDYQRRLCDWYGYEKHPYDALLDDYEKGANVEVLDAFFSALREGLVPLVKEIGASGVKPAEISGEFDIDKQKSLLPWLTDFVGYDRARGKTGEVEHPFCTTVNRNDVRITTKYHADKLLSALFSTVHESGHAIYEQNMPEALDRYGLADGASMGMHESQSRLYENIICRSKAFAARLLPKLRETFAYFDSWDEDSLYRAINITCPSLIRIEADELTYSMHIMIRYELEKAIITGDIKVSDLPGLWNDKYTELLGVRPENDAEGVLQDVHWSGGMVGYFPSYAVGTAYGAQFVNAMKKSVDVDRCVEAGDLSPVVGWLTDNVYRHGAVLLPSGILKEATGELFNPAYYVDYLSDKFSSLYK